MTEGEVIRFYFILQNSSGNPVASDGTVMVTVGDNVEAILHQTEFEVRSGEFVDYQNNLTGQPIGKAYEWRIPTAEIEKGIASIWGVANLRFTTPGGLVLSARDETVDIETYTADELLVLSEEEYTRSARAVGLVAEGADFKVTVESVGTHTVYSTYSAPETKFRVDLAVTAKKSKYLWRSDAFAFDEVRASFETDYDSSFKFGELLAGSACSGHVLFEGVGAETVVESVMFGDYVFDILWGEAYTKQQRAEEEYATSAWGWSRKTRI